MRNQLKTETGAPQDFFVKMEHLEGLVAQIIETGIGEVITAYLEAIELYTYSLDVTGASLELANLRREIAATLKSVFINPEVRISLIYIMTSLNGLEQGILTLAHYILEGK